jgi:Ca2+-binding RTX toxin-like protein
VVTGPAYGETSVNPQTGKITYTPNRGFVGTDTFTYKVCDESGACSNDATVTITVEPAACTIRGTNGNDNLRGTDGPDVICGGGGNDKIDGLGGDDIIRGGDGRDTMKGGTGKDRLFGEGGKDFLNVLDRARSNDRADGGSGKDDCAADRGDKRVSC